MIRRATPADLDDILRLVADSVVIMRQAGNTQWDDDYPDRARFAADIADGALLVFVQKGVICGVLCANREEPPEYTAMPWQSHAPALVLHRMAIAPAFRRRGAARALMTYAENAARRDGLTWVHTDTNVRNTPVNCLLLDMGYTPVGHIALRGNPHPFCCYEKRL